jgi:3-oxoacyl-[acyl-carrier-protein] synthase II
MHINILGGGWVTANGFGMMDKGDAFSAGEGAPVIPAAKEIFTQQLTRYGRFDTYTKLGCAAIALALKDAGLDQTDQKRHIGVIVSTVYECFESDLAFQETTIEEDGSFSSPNLFSYTLPGIVIGEAAIYFKLTGPTFTVGDQLENRGLSALATAKDLIESGACDLVVAGWLDSPNELLKTTVEPDDQIRGALFTVLSNKESKSSKKIKIENAEFYLNSDKKITSLPDLFQR